MNLPFVKFKLAKPNIGDISILFFNFKFITRRDHPLSTYAKFSEKLIFITPWYAHGFVGFRGKKSYFFGENGLCTKCMILYLHRIQLLIYDRAHRIGKSFHHIKSKKKCKSIIVRFISFRYRTKAYRRI